MTNPNLGMGVMISYLRGNQDSVEAYTAAVGKTIAAATLSDDALRLVFTDGSAIELYDDGQSCCEARYLRTDDNLTRIIGATLVSVEVRAAADGEYGGEDVGAHEICFLDVQTSNGLVQICAHNEHNGYYGGFSMRCRSVAGQP